MGILDSEAFLKCAGELVAVGAFFNQQGWAPATSGNYSARLDDESVAITVSGVHKGHLKQDELMLVDLEGTKVAAHRQEQRSSAETLLHTQLYAHDESIGAVLHSHSAISTVISRLRSERVILEGYEVQKALPGVETHASRVIVPIFNNQQDIPRLAREVAACLEGPEPMVGYLIRGHGLYSWGQTVADACRHIEAFEFLFECELLEERVQR